MITFTSATSGSIGNNDNASNDNDNNNVIKEEPSNAFVPSLTQDSGHLGHLSESFITVQTPHQLHYHSQTTPLTLPIPNSPPSYLFSPPPPAAASSSPSPSSSVDPAMMTAKALKRAPDPPLHFRAGAKRPLTYERRASPTPGSSSVVSGGGGRFCRQDRPCEEMETARRCPTIPRKSAVYVGPPS